MTGMDPWRKPQAEMVDRFHEAAAGIEGLDIRKMFGFPAGFIGGNMAVGLHQDTLIVRLPEDERRERIDSGWRQFEPMPGRPMREYLALPEAVAADPAEARRWMERAAAYVRTLPPKAAKAAKAPKSARPKA
jgi:TfoX/Sxy family transcriptional regulator of competence genes